MELSLENYLSLIDLIYMLSVKHLRVVSLMVPRESPNEQSPIQKVLTNKVLMMKVLTRKVLMRKLLMRKVLNIKNMAKSSNGSPTQA